MEKEEKYVMKRWIGIPLAIVLGDGAVKKCAEEKLEGGKAKELFGGRIRLQLLHNHGFGFTDGQRAHPKTYERFLF